MSDYAIGIDLGGTNLKGALVQRGKGLVEKDSIPTEADQGPEHVIQRIASLTQQLIQQAPNSSVVGIGIGAPGAIDWERSTVSQPPNLPGWGTQNLRTQLQSVFGPDMPVVLGNDANVAGLGSAHYSTGRPYDSFIMITLGTGVGGAVIYQNRIFRGSTGGAGEIGHMTVDYEGPFARSGVAGAIEGYLGQHFLSRHARYRLLQRTESRIHEMANDDLTDITPEMLYHAAEAGDEPAREVLAWAGHKLGCVLGSAVNLLDIRTIIVGGGVSAAGAYILDPARETLPRYVVPGLHEGLKILREESGNDVGLLGAAHLVFQQDDE
jgi:glucokinase